MPSLKVPFKFLWNRVRGLEPLKTCIRENEIEEGKPSARSSNYGHKFKRVISQFKQLSNNELPLVFFHFISRVICTQQSLKIMARNLLISGIHADFFQLVSMKKSIFISLSCSKIFKNFSSIIFFKFFSLNYTPAKIRINIKNN